VIPSFHVHIRRRARREIGASGLSRRALVRFLSWLYDELEHRAARHQGNRGSGQPERILVRKLILDGGVSHHFVFAVDDQQPGKLFIEDCRRGTGGT